MDNEYDKTKNYGSQTEKKKHTNTYQNVYQNIGMPILK